MTTPCNKLNDLSWVVFTEEDTPGCEVEQCNKEAVKRLGPVGCGCNATYPYCVEHFKMHRDWLHEELELVGSMQHSLCENLFYDYKVEDI